MNYSQLCVLFYFRFQLLFHAGIYADLTSEIEPMRLNVRWSSTQNLKNCSVAWAQILLVPMGRTSPSNTTDNSDMAYCHHGNRPISL